MLRASCAGRQAPRHPASSHTELRARGILRRHPSKSQITSSAPREKARRHRDLWEPSAGGSGEGGRETEASQGRRCGVPTPQPQGRRITARSEGGDWEGQPVQTPRGGKTPGQSWRRRAERGCAGTQTQTGAAEVCGPRWNFGPGRGPRKPRKARKGPGQCGKKQGPRPRCSRPSPRPSPTLAPQPGQRPSSPHPRTSRRHPLTAAPASVPLAPPQQRLSTDAAAAIFRPPP